MQKLKCKIIYYEDSNHLTHIAIDICDLVIYTDLDPFANISEEQFYETLTTILDLSDSTLEELIYRQQNGEEFRPHKILSEEEYIFKYFDSEYRLKEITIQ